MNKLVSVIIPSYNRSFVIAETLACLQQQSYQTWEAIVVDDGSEDNTFQLVLELAEKDNRIKPFQRNSPVKGAPVCRNIGIHKAQGDYIIFLDSDDLLAPYALQNRVFQFAAHPNADFLVFYGAFFNEKIGDATVLWNRFDEGLVDLERFLKGEPVWQTSGPIWKAAFINNQQHFFDETAASSQDWEFHVRALLKQPTYKTIEGVPDYFIRRQPGYNRISEEHWSYDKIIKRVRLYSNMITRHLLPCGHQQYATYVLLIILKQHHYMLKNLNRTFDAAPLKAIFPQVQHLPYKVALAYYYLLIGNKCLKGHKILYKLVRKVCEELFLNKLFFYPSRYRSAMTEQEQQAFQIRLNQLVHAGQ